MADSFIKVKTQPPFGVIVSRGAKDYLQPALSSAKKALLVCDDNVCKIHGHHIKKVIERDTLEIYTFIYPATENGKSKYILDKLLILMTEINLTETDVIISLGGRETMAITGFAACLFKGGIPHIALPTTLTGMTGGCLSGKVGTDFLGRENLLSAHYYPKAVFCDVDFTKTLSEEQVLHGLAEIMRCAIAVDKKSFCTFEKQGFALEDGIACLLKVNALIESKKGGYKQKVNLLKFGGIFANAIRYVSHYTVTKGDALAAGIMMSVEIAEKTGLAVGLYDRLVKVFNNVGVVYEISVKKDRVIDYIVNDIKEKPSGVNILLPEKIGKLVVKNFTAETLKDVWYGF